MPITPTYPGVYVDELPSPVRTIVGVGTSITAFVGQSQRGYVNDPTPIQRFADFERMFGGLWPKSTMSYAVWQYFLNGGSDAVIVRVVHQENVPQRAAPSIVSLPANSSSLDIEASNPGTWGDNLRVRVDHATRDTTNGTLFNLFVKDAGTDQIEEFRNVSTDAASPRFVDRILEHQSDLVRVAASSASPRVLPDENSPPPGLDMFPDPSPTSNPVPSVYRIASAGSDGNDIDDSDIVGDPNAKTGLYALDTEDFNLLCVPPRTRDIGPAPSTWGAALAYCHKRRAMLLVDPPVGNGNEWRTAAAAKGTSGPTPTGFPALNLTGDDSPYGAIYFPLIVMADPKSENALTKFVPCGAVAGVFARTDATRGVWKAPAGQDAGLAGVQKLSVDLADGESGLLNPVGINCLRHFPIVGNVVWGARTLQGADQLASQWKYVPVRRLASYVEESLDRGTKWVVFEPNDEPLWAQIRLNVGAFMNTLYRQGAFQGRTPADAYFVKCDKETTTQDDINRGVVNILVGFAPLKPAEFVIIKISQMAGQVQT